MPYKIIGIHGHAYAGKDTVAAFLMRGKKMAPSHTISFATPLKVAADGIFGHFNYALGDKEAMRPEWGVSQRVILQSLGASLRKGLGESIFINSLVKTLNYRFNCTSLNDYSSMTIPLYIIIPDVRFKNEVDWVYSQGGTILHVKRPGADGKVGIPQHISESTLTLKGENTYVILNDGSLKELEKKVTSIFNRIIAIK